MARSRLAPVRNLDIFAACLARPVTHALPAGLDFERLIEVTARGRRAALDRQTRDHVAQIGFTEWTAGGKLRHPRFLGLRDDKRSEDIVREG
jgi:hypothetical protein